jgi:cytochrome P450
MGDDGVVIDYEMVDYFTDPDLVHDPYPYYEHLRAKCPVQRASRGVVGVTGYDEVTEVFRDWPTFSAVNSTSGPFLRMPVPLEGDDISEIIDNNREYAPGYLDMVTMDPPDHTRERALLMRLITPKRLRENEEFMWRLAGDQLDRIVGAGRCEFISAYAQPFAMLSVADMLGVPEADHETFREGLARRTGNASTIQLGGGEGGNYEDRWLDDYFTTYIEDRRREPRRDVMTDLALAKYPDGSTPPVAPVVRTATFLFAAGEETTARLLAVSVKYLALYPELQDELRAHPERIPNFIEEALRIESPTKADSRLARRAASIAGVDVDPGSTVVLFLGAANRDPRRFERPGEFRVDRENAKEHVAFGRGIHSCPGAPLARAEGRISVQRIVERMRNIRLSEEHHGSPPNYHFVHEPTWVLHAMAELHIEFDPT